MELIEWWLPYGDYTSRMRWRIARKDTRRKTKDIRVKSEEKKTEGWRGEKLSFEITYD